MRVLILSTNWRFTRCLSVGLNLAGHEVYTTAERRRSPESFSRCCKQVLAIGADELKAGDRSLVDRINRTIDRYHIEAIVPAFTRAVDLVGRYRDELAAPCYPLAEPDTIELMRDKQRFAEFLDRIGVDQPQHCVAATADDAASIPFDGPYIVKPPRGEGGEDVVALADRDAVARRLEQIVPKRGPQLVQSFVPGSDIDLSLLADRGRVVAYTIQRKTDRRGMLEFLDHPGVAEACSRISAGCGFHGVMHLDLRVDGRDGKVYAIESNPRFWNSMRYSFALGVNFADLGLRIMGGETVEPMIAPPTGVIEPADITLDPAGLRRLIHTPTGVPEAYRATLRQVRRDPLPDLWYALQQMPKPWKKRDASPGDSPVGQKLLDSPHKTPGHVLGDASPSVAA
ncbi:MAG: ATP-grasp domain-containing protein [Planctomycetota bacterium]